MTQRREGERKMASQKKRGGEKTENIMASGEDEKRNPGMATLRRKVGKG